MSHAHKPSCFPSPHLPASVAYMQTPPHVLTPQPRRSANHAMFSPHMGSQRYSSYSSGASSVATPRQSSSMQATPRQHFVERVQCGPHTGVQNSSLPEEHGWQRSNYAIPPPYPAATPRQTRQESSKREEVLTAVKDLAQRLDDLADFAQTNAVYQNHYTDPYDDSFSDETAASPARRAISGDASGARAHTRPVFGSHDKLAEPHFSISCSEQTHYEPDAQDGLAKTVLPRLCQDDSSPKRAAFLDQSVLALERKAAMFATQGEEAKAELISSFESEPNLDPQSIVGVPRVEVVEVLKELENMEHMLVKERESKLEAAETYEKIIKDNEVSHARDMAALEEMLLSALQEKNLLAAQLAAVQAKKASRKGSSLSVGSGSSPTISDTASTGVVSENSSDEWTPGSDEASATFLSCLRPTADETSPTSTSSPRSL